MGSPRSVLRAIFTAVLATSLLLLAACSSGSGSTSTGNGHGATATNTAVSPTATTTPTSCAQLPGLSGATALNLFGLTYPPGAVAAAPHNSAGGTGQFTVSVYSACAPNTDANLTFATGKGPTPFTKILLFSGWASSKTFPADGQFQSACSSQCFIGPDGTQYLSLASITPVVNGLVTFQLIVATPPPAPTCDPSHFGDNTYVTSIQGPNNTTIYLPPLTRISTDKGGGYAGGVVTAYCSAGSGASVNAFLQATLPNGGWQSAGPSSWKTSNGQLTWTMDITVNTPAMWTINQHVPM